MDELTDQQRDWCDGLSAIADFYREHPDLIPNRSQRVQDMTCGDDEKERAVAYVRALGGANKEWSDSLLTVKSKAGRFGPHFVEYVALRESVCTKTVTVVEKEVTERDPELLETVPLVTRTVIEEVIEWDCDPLLAEVAS